MTQPRDLIALETGRGIVPSRGYRAEKKGRRVAIVPGKDARVDKLLTVRFR